MTMKEWALHWASLGIPVFPCRADKRPLVGRTKDSLGGFHRATCDVEVIGGWWDRWPDALIGYPTGARSGIDFLDLDFDEKKKKNGLEEIPGWLELSNIIIRTPRGGRHIWFKYSGIKCTTDQIAHGVDTRGDGGYGFLPPSRTDLGEYTFEKGDENGIKWLPEFPLELAGRLEPRGEVRVSSEATGDIELIELALKAIPNEDIDYIKWNERGMATWRATEGSEKGFSAFDSWSKKSTKYDPKYTRKRWDHFSDSPPTELGKGTLFFLANQESYDWDLPYYKRIADEIDIVSSGVAREEQEAYLREHVWKAGNGTTPPKKLNGSGGGDESDLVKMNSKYSVILDGGKVRVLFFKEYSESGGGSGYVHVRNATMFISFEDFRNLHLNRTVFEYDRKKDAKVAVPLGHWWLRHPMRRQYEGIVFDPSGGPVVGGNLNLWRGWGVEAREGDWSLMKEHIRVVLAGGDADSFSYIMKWLAWTVQNPSRRAEVALVFKGGRGSGKGTLGNTMCRLFGQHGTHLSNAKKLTGFNAHLRDACLLFVDEAYWPGDKSAEGDLKRLITEPTLQIEAKGRDSVVTENMSHVIIASNEDWIVPAGERERRYAAFLCDDRHMQDDSWFTPIYQQMEGGGYGAMLHELLEMDLGGFHPRHLSGVKGKELIDQQSRSLDPFDMWWVELLENGVLEGSDPENPHQSFSNGFIDGSGIRRKGLYDQAREIEPRLRGRSDHLMGRYLKSRVCCHAWVFRRRGWAFRSLLELRKEWEARFPGWNWRDLGIEAWVSNGEQHDDESEM